MTVASRLACPLAEARDPSLAGGKARNLARLIALAVPVPTGVVLTVDAFERFLDDTGLRARIETRLVDADLGDPVQAQAAAVSIASMIDAASLPADLRDALESESGTWVRATSVAVRSSAVGEDGERASFAGQLDTVLNVDAADAAALIRAIRTCWASYWSARALSYRSARAASLAGMAVVIQEQVDAAMSGVLFTREPDDRQRAEGRGDTAACGDERDAGAMLVEYCEGLGDALVSGLVDPGRLRIRRDDLTVEELQTLPRASEAAAAALTPASLADLARIALDIERAFGTPQDIEWSVDVNGRLWILQTRPITTTVPTDRGPRFADRDARSSAATVLWSNANVNENFPEPISPLLYSIASAGYYHYFRNLGVAFGISRRRLAGMDRPLRGLIGVHDGRMYYNLTNLHAVLRMAPFGEHLGRAFNAFVGAGEIAGHPEGARRWTDPRRLAGRAAEFARIAAQTTWQYLGLGHRVRQFERNADRFAARAHPGALAVRSLDDLLGDLSAFMDIRCHRWTNASLADAAAMVSYAMLQRALARAGADPPVANRLLRALPGVPSSQPALRLWDLSRLIRSDARLATLFATGSPADVLRALDVQADVAPFKRQFDRYLEDWGFRSSSELMLTVASLEERPEPVIELLRQYARSGDEAPADVMARQATGRRRETSRLLRRVARRSPIRAFSVWRWLSWTQRAVAYRERVRLKQALLYTRCRRIALAIGDRLTTAGLLDAPDDVFQLAWHELDELASGRAMFPRSTRELIALRKAEHARFAARRPPDTVRLPAGAYLTDRAAAGPASGAGAQPTESGAAVLTGASACGGRVTARAAVLLDVNEAARLSRGDVLVTRQTDPGWGPVFCLISGLVIERGGMLSHGAIIAREFGLPCLVGVPDATSRIPHGGTVTVDADAGRCVVLPAVGKAGS